MRWEDNRAKATTTILYAVWLALPGSENGTIMDNPDLQEFAHALEYELSKIKEWQTQPVRQQETQLEKWSTLRWLTSSGSG